LIPYFIPCIYSLPLYGKEEAKVGKIKLKVKTPPPFFMDMAAPFTAGEIVNVKLTIIGRFSLTNTSTTLVWWKL
jgi:hypothetical protein